MNSKIVLLMSIVMYVLTVVGYAGAREDYEEASKIYKAAALCMATYSDRYGSLANRYLEQDGWKIVHYTQAPGSLDVRFLLAEKRLSNGEYMHMLAIVGSENVNHLKVDLKVDKVYFAGSNLEEFAANAAIGGSATDPKVHRGFHEFVQTGLMVKTTDSNGKSKYLTEILLENKDHKVYLVGHSLGGAAATLAGARLISMGVRPEQIEIVTFGAPAVGNAAFAEKFEPLLNLTRVVISGDPVTGILQGVSGGYQQFGRKIKWHQPVNAEQSHQLTQYADFSIKYYYQERQRALQAGVLQPLAFKSGKGPGYYVAPLKNSLPEVLGGEYWYMQQVVWDEYRKILPSYILSNSITEDIWQSAVAAGCKWLIIPEVSAYRIKEQNVFYVTLDQTIYSIATRRIVKVASFSTGTYNLTPLEAVFHDFRGINGGSQNDWVLDEIL